MMHKKTHIILLQLGSPKSTSTSDVRSYLKEFLGDYRVVDLPRFFWNIILYCFILTFRPKKSAKAYKRIEFCAGFFPLIEITKAMGRALSERFKGKYEVHAGFILSEPRLKGIFDKWTNSKENLSETKFLILPQYPQYSGTTVASCYDQLENCFYNRTNLPTLEVVSNYHRLKAYIDLSVEQIEHQIQKYPADDIVLSFHGIPVRYVTEKGDLYLQHCFETFKLIKERLNFPKEKIHMTFQSRFGSEQWLNPYTDEFVVELAENGSKSIAVYCPAFVADCLETVDEIGTELAEEVEEAGAELVFVPCLNNSEKWVKAYGDFIETYLEGSKNERDNLFYDLNPEEVEREMPKFESEEKLTPKAKKTIKLVFLTLFLDLVGFSIIFPMFPSLAKYYLENDTNNPFLKLIFGSIAELTKVGGVDMNSIVLFGGALGALYSLLQFFAAPLWGGISDRYGRKPILLISIFGLFLSYVIWIFSGSFTLLILSRFIGGIMGGNLSVATATIADVTTPKTRSKGMAFVGIAFALGFIFGPAIGGALTAMNPVVHFSEYEAWGINPFSYAALFAAILSFINLISIAKNFEETLDTSNTSKRVVNIFKLFKPIGIREVNLTNYSYFLFISAFSGMEFTLTFLAVERFAYTSMDNAYMFVFIGILIALVQGGFVRRKAHNIGEKKVAVMGLLSLVPGLLIIAYASNGFLLYLGLFFLAVGSAMAVPTLTSLVSLYTPAADQGQSLGIFRSLGSLGRVIGPIIASLVYWKFGSVVPYLGGAIFLILPILVLNQIKQKA